MCGGKEKSYELEGMPQRRNLPSVPRPHYMHSRSNPHPPLPPSSPFLFLSPVFLIPSYQDAETAMSQAVNRPTVTRAPEPSPALAPLSSPVPVALTSAMLITAICLLWAARGLLAPRVPWPPQVGPWGAEAGWGLGPRLA